MRQTEGGVGVQRGAWTLEQVDERLDSVDEKNERRFRELGKKVEWFNDQVNIQLNEQSLQLQRLHVVLKNAAAVEANRQITRIHQPIQHIYIRRPKETPNEELWAAHMEPPVNLKDVYLLGQRAKGEFGSSWEKTPVKQRELVFTIILSSHPSVFFFFLTLFWFLRATHETQSRQLAAVAHRFLRRFSVV